MLPILHPSVDPSLKMNRVPSEFFQTGLFSEAEALALERTYNPPSDCEVLLSPVTSMAPQLPDVKKIHDKLETI